MSTFIQVGDANNETGMFFISVHSAEIKASEYGGPSPYTLILNKGMSSEYVCPAQNEEGKSILKWLKEKTYTIKEHRLTKEENGV
jgi:hypothetical protein